MARGGAERAGRLTLDLTPGRPLIEGLGLAKGEARAGPRGAQGGRAGDLHHRRLAGRRAGPAPGEERLHHLLRLAGQTTPRHRPLHPGQGVRPGDPAGRAARTIAIAGLSVGPFAGELRITVYAGAALVHVESAVKTEDQDLAYFYDAGLVSGSPNWKTIAYLDTEGRLVREPSWAGRPTRFPKVRHRTLVAEAEEGSVACFPPPHQYFFPRDYTDNLGTVWDGHLVLDHRGFGIRQVEAGGGNFSPWINAPPGTEQRLGVFYLVSRGKAEDALREVLRYTHGDRFPDLPGYQTLSSHWHMAITMAAIKEQQADGGKRTTPDLVKMFKDMNVRAVHLAEFHGDGHPQDTGPVRLAEMEAMFAECRRLSDDRLLLIPGEEANVYLGPRDPKTPQGHWLYLFPKPVTWTMRRG